MNSRWQMIAFSVENGCGVVHQNIITKTMCSSNRMLRFMLCTSFVVAM